MANQREASPSASSRGVSVRTVCVLSIKGAPACTLADWEMRGDGIGLTGSGAISSRQPVGGAAATDAFASLCGAFAPFWRVSAESISAPIFGTRHSSVPESAPESSPDATDGFAWASAAGVGDAVAARCSACTESTAGESAGMTGLGSVGAAASRRRKSGSGRACASLGTSRSFCAIEDSALLAPPGGSSASVAAPICRSLLRVSTST